MPASGAAQSRDDAAVFAALKQILEPYSKGLRVAHDTADLYYLESAEKTHNGRPVMFAAVRRGKAYVSFHLMPGLHEREAAGGDVGGVEAADAGQGLFQFQDGGGDALRRAEEVDERGACVV